MKILVTGASGFIGSHLCECLLAKGYKVKAFVRYTSKQNIGWLENIKNKNLEIIFGDIVDFDSVKNAVKGCDYIFNLAASISVPYSYKNPQTFIDTNIIGALNILRTSIFFKKKIKKIIQISSSEVYGNNLFKTKRILKEDTVTIAESPYAATKISSDNMAISMHQSSGIPVVVARPFNTFGPRQSLRAVIPTLITQFLLLNKNNNDVTIGNLKTSRDFVYVQDTVDALVSLLKPSCQPGNIYNICTGKSFAINEIIKILKIISKKNPNIIVAKKRLRTAEVFNLRGSNKKLYSANRWVPKYKNSIGFKKALLETYIWFKEEQNFKHYKDIKKYNF
jgi:nucleoside-diphosphate-sugar epimerase